ncbi:glycosyltransferase [Roseomonas sp. KE2513]|uniref:glycosyltransferase n=1 Tax=Roseomonas sp. KE2513 TaxID=2479202 RepID=UPI0018DFBA50|nr:glycosyltransferase [Roseomonas sp. KE2513]
MSTAAPDLAARLRDGRACLRSGHSEAAVALLQGVVDAAPEAPEAKALLATALEASGNKHRARMLWLEIGRQAGPGGDGRHLWRLGRYAAERGDHAEAERMLSAYLAVSPGDLAAAELLLEARLSLAEGPVSRRAVLEQHAADWPETAFSLTLVATEAHRAGNTAAARATLDRAEGMWSSSIAAAVRIAEARDALSQTAAAVAMLERAIAVHPGVAALWRTRLRVAQSAGEDKAALLGIAARIVALEPDKAGPRVGQARLMAGFKDWAGAADAWRHALTLDRTVVEHWRGLMVALANLERNAALEKLLEEARVYFRGRGAEGLVDLAVLESTCGWHDRAAALAAGVMAHPQTRGRARGTAAAALLKGGHYQRAWGYLSAAVEEGNAAPETLRMAVRCAAALRLPAPGAGVAEFPDTLFERALLHPPERPLIAPTPTFMLVTSSLSAGGAERQVALSAAGVARHLAERGLGRAVLVGLDLNPERGRSTMRPVAEVPELTIEDLAKVSAPALFRDITAAEPAARAALELMAALPAGISRDVIKLYDCFRRFRPELVHLWQDGVITSGSVAAVLAGVPRIVASTRNVVATETDRRRYRRYLSTMYLSLARCPGAHFTANSGAGAQDYERWLGMAPGRIQVIRNGLELPAVRARAPAAARQAVRAELGLAPDDLLMGGTFRLAPAKRPHLWLAVAELVAARVPRSRFVIVGDGALRAELEALIKERGLSGRVTLAGRRSPVEPWIGAMDVMLLASEVEGLPNVLLEAQALGVPVVTTNAGGSAEAVLDGITGVLVPTDDAGPLADAVARVLRDEPMRARARVGAPAFIEQRFGIARMLSDTLDAYGVSHQPQGFKP